MYHQVSIAKLSENAKSRLRNGHPVRVRLHSDGYHKIHVSKEQLKKLQRAKDKNKAATITFDPHQMEHHGKGIFGNIASSIRKHGLQQIVNPIISGVKKSAHRGVSKLSKYAHEKIDKLHEIEGGTIKRRGRPRKTGKGVIGSVLQNLIGMSGIGLKKRGRKKGTGLLSNLALAAAPALIDGVANMVKKKVTGGRVRKPRKTRRGGALMPA